MNDCVRLVKEFNAFSVFDMPGGEGWHDVPGLAVTIELPAASGASDAASVLVTIEYSLAWRGWQYLHAALFADGQIVPFSEALSSDAGLFNAVSKQFTVQIARSVRKLQVRATGGSAKAAGFHYEPNHPYFWSLTHRRLVVTLPAPAPATWWTQAVLFDEQALADRMALVRLRLTESAAALSRVNVLVVGPPGAGKSSLVNSLFSCVQGRVVEAAQVGTSTRSLTLSFDSYALTLPRAERAICLCDTLGWEHGSYATGEFGYMLDGNVSAGMQLRGSITPQTPRFRANPTRDDRMHVVVFVVPALDCDSADNLARIADVSRLAAARNVGCVLLLTFLDQLDAKLARNASAVVQSVRVARARERVAAATRIPLTNVSVTMNQPDFEFDVAAGNVAMRALQLAVERAIDRAH